MPKKSTNKGVPMRYQLTYLLDSFFSELLPNTCPARLNFDQSDNKEDFNYSLALPGVKKEEIKVFYNSPFLTVAIDSKRQKKTEAFRLPEEIFDYDKINVKYEDGLLEINLPVKKEEKKPVKIIELK